MTYTKQKIGRTPKGYKHLWAYHGRWNEKKLSPRKWRFTFRATKGKRAKSFGSFKKGFNVTWKINAIQKATKVGRGKYQTIMTGTKKLIRTGNKRRKR